MPTTEMFIMPSNSFAT